MLRQHPPARSLHAPPQDDSVHEATAINKTHLNSVFRLLANPINLQHVNPHIYVRASLGDLDTSFESRPWRLLFLHVILLAKTQLL